MMLVPIRPLLDKKRIILASTSPRRRDLIHLLGINAAPVPSRFEENLNPNNYATVAEYVEATAMGKAEEVYNRLSAAYGGPDQPNNLIVLGADTVVSMDGKIYGKPKDKKQAEQFLNKLSGRSNRVYTGVVIKYFGGRRKFSEWTDVFFGKLSQEQINAYVSTGEPLDKAGGYGINGIGGSFISRIEGDYYCVMGLPLHRTSLELYDLFENELTFDK